MKENVITGEKILKGKVANTRLQRRGYEGKFNFVYQIERKGGKGEGEGGG
jgi:hypothetical protein